MNKKFASAAMAATMVASLALAIPAFAQDKGPDNDHGNKNGWQGMMRSPGQMKKFEDMRPGIFGTVTAINGNTITVNVHKTLATSSPATSYTVDATSAKVMKNNATSTVSAIAVGDSLIVRGTVNGTNVTATMIRDGVMMKGPGQGGKGPQTLPIQGNGQPIVAGTISAVNGATLTITTTSNVTYTVDTTNAKIYEGKDTALISSLTVGEHVLVQGTVNGNAVTASSVIGQKAQANGTPKPQAGFLGGIGQFFMHLFGF